MEYPENKKHYPARRDSSYEEVERGLKINIEGLACHLASLLGEEPRVGEIGGGQGYTSQRLNSKGIETINIDPLPAPANENHHLPGEYPAQRFPHTPHLIIAHQAIVSLTEGHSAKEYYADFNAIASSIATDAELRVGTVIIDSSWPVERSLEPGLKELADKGFNLISPRALPQEGSRMSLVLSRVKDLKLDPFRKK